MYQNLLIMEVDFKMKSIVGLATLLAITPSAGNTNLVITLNQSIDLSLSVKD